ncbi:TonB family protein [Roseovarius sp. Pro17]|uniref:energy transducer TonB family protein n=1 Tax=Roseovarius sp. Pro17 TaxID=3108175 RepID=UPI002D79FCB3|nr:TonB family protein [Roseovarius sp. Pro17]
MIAASRSIQIGAVLAAVLVHGALAMALMPDGDVQIDGGAGAPEARLGSSFADMAAGTLKAAKAVDAAQPVPIEAAQQPIKPEAGTPPKRPSISPDTTVAALTPIPSLSRALEALKPDIPTAGQAQPAATQAERTEEMLEFEGEVSAAVTRSLRPKRRSEEFESAHERPKPKAAAKAQRKSDPEPKEQPTNRGNAQQNATAGAATGKATAKAAASGSAGKQPQASGNAAASNYPGLVMHKISRVPRPRAGSRGTAVVGFSVTGGGGLASVHLVGSSGSAQLDRAALQMIHRAAPFPAPPAGAQRSFTINIEGR